MLLLLPQRYVFSSKSQRVYYRWFYRRSCYCYHKGTYFQANHNRRTCEVRNIRLLLLPQRYVFSSKSQRYRGSSLKTPSCYCYHKGTYFQANHNNSFDTFDEDVVVIATTKVRIFKQITTAVCFGWLPKSCYCYHKGTYFQANHNSPCGKGALIMVVIATTKVRIFKQITTDMKVYTLAQQLLLLPQRYVFSSKSQHVRALHASCMVVIATTKVRIFKQITTLWLVNHLLTRCYCYHKGTYFQANHNICVKILI